MKVLCGREDCTVAETGVCLLNNDPMECPARLVEGEDDEKKPELERDLVSFAGSSPLGLSGARDLMAERPVRLVGILGEPASGKTACLVSLYLLLAKNELSGFGFADSRTLMGLEEISQGARRWSAGDAPETLTTHTELRDDRTAGFLHVRVSSSFGTFDLMLPDLPGEWTRSLVDLDRHDRLMFLQRADVLWIVVNGADLLSIEGRQGCIHRTRLLIDRLAAFLTDRPPMMLVMSRTDQGSPDDAVLGALRERGLESGFEVHVVPIASFSENDEVGPGFGIAELVRKSTASDRPRYELWPDLGLEAKFTPPIIELGKGAV